MSDYRGPLEGDGIAEYILEDAKVILFSAFKPHIWYVYNHFYEASAFSAAYFDGEGDRGDPPEQFEHHYFKFVQRRRPG